jgi:hypothetical protein
VLDNAEGRLKTIRAAFFILRTGANLDSEITNLKITNLKINVL